MVRTVEPDLADAPGRAAALPGARAAVLARLWGALSREPLPGLSRERHAGVLTVGLPGGERLTGPAAAAEPFALVDDDFRLWLSGAGRRPQPGRAAHGTGGSDAQYDGPGDPVAYHDPAALLAGLALPHCPAEALARFAAELDNSVANLALARAAQPAPHGGPGTLAELALGELADPLAYLEQCVVDGHPLHPCCRTRMGMSAAEVLDYAPEHRPVVNIELVAVPRERWLTTGAGLPALLPVHPWQRDHVLERYPGLRPTGRQVAARPLMSLRTLAPLVPDSAGAGGGRGPVPTWPGRLAEQHWKTAVDVQMTSAVRTVSPAAVRNGPAVSTLVGHLAARTGGLAMLPEIAAGAVLVDGAPCRSLAVAVRRAPRLARGELAAPVAALAAPSPADGRPLVVEAVRLGYGGDPVAFFGALCGVLLPPLLALLHAGVALEAHGQNTLVVLRAGRPVRALYRDVGGVRISPARLRAHGVDPPPLHGDLGSDEPAVLRRKLFAAVLAGLLAEQVAVLCREFGVQCGPLWARASAVARGAYAALPASAAPDSRALFDAVLPVKATTAMRLAADGLADLWAPLPNPLAEHA